MSSLVLELQQEVMNPDCDVLNALRRAHVIAVKLKLKEFDIWIQSELNGYSDNDGTIPDYRKVKGLLKAFNPYRGWIPTQLTDDEIENMICTRTLSQSLGEIQELYNCSTKSDFLIEFSSEQMELISSLFHTPIPMRYAVHVSTHLLKVIIEKVKNCLLEWTVRLEDEGILGNGMRFSREETDIAKKVPQTINNYYAPVINGDIKQRQVIFGDCNTVSFSYDEVNDLMERVRESLIQEQLATDDRDSAMELIAEAETKITEHKKPGVIHAILGGLRDFLISTGANVTAALIIQYLQGMG